VSAARAALSPVYRFLELAGFYALNQRLGRPTTDRFRALIADNLPLGKDTRLLDLGCGVGNYRSCFPDAYTGIDVNPAYIERARATLPGRFATMDCTALDFADASFDEVVTIATAHHLDDGQLERMVAEALRVRRQGGHLHIIDAILPISPSFLFKRIWFRLDRGAFPRTQEDLVAGAERAGRVIRRELLTGPLHDTIYLRVAPAAIA